MIEREDAHILAAALDWYHLAGVDMVTADRPTDWFEVSRKPAPALLRTQTSREPVRPPARGATASRGRIERGPGQAPAPNRRPAKQAHADHTLAPVPAAKALQEARERAARATTIDELKATLGEFDGCSLKKMARNLCFGDGNPQSSLMLVGEAPGRDEDLRGVPFVGRAGKLLDKMLQAIELSRQDDVWITNSVYWRPPGNRTPSQQETEICRPFLERQIELIKPDIIVALGGAAAKHLLQTTSGIMRLRGKWREIEVAGESYRVLPTLHPAFLLRTPAAKRLAWRDLLTIRAHLNKTRQS